MPEHLFYVDHHGWIGAGQINIRDQPTTKDGTTVEVADNVHRQAEKPVYNLEVEGFHTYHISHAQLLVHNSCIGLPIKLHPGGSYEARGESLSQRQHLGNTPLGFTTTSSTVCWA